MATARAVALGRARAPAWRFQCRWPGDPPRYMDLSRTRSTGAKIDLSEVGKPCIIGFMQASRSGAVVAVKRRVDLWPRPSADLERVAPVEHGRLIRQT